MYDKNLAKFFYFNGTNWIEMGSAAFIAGSGINFVGNNIVNTGDTNASDDITTATVAGGVLTGNFPNPGLATGAVTSAKIADGTIIAADLAAGAVSNSRLAADAVTTDKIANGTILAIDLAAGVLPTSLPPNGTAGGDLTGNFPVPTIANDAVNSAKILDGTVTAADLAAGVLPTSLPPNGTAGGDLTGNFPVPTIANDAVNSAKILDGTVTAADLAVGVLPTSLPPNGAAGGDLTGNFPTPTIANDAVNSAKILDGTVTALDLAAGVLPTSLPPNGAAGGDLTGNFPMPTIANDAIVTTKLANSSVTAPKINSDGVFNGKVLTANGTGGASWESVGGNYVGGGGINISANTISNTGDTNANDDITNNTPMSGALTGTLPNATLAQNNAKNGDALTWSDAASSFLPKHADSDWRTLSIPGHSFSVLDEATFDGSNYMPGTLAGYNAHYIVTEVNGSKVTFATGGKHAVSSTATNGDYYLKTSGTHAQTPDSLHCFQMYSLSTEDGVKYCNIKLSRCNEFTVDGNGLYTGSGNVAAGILYAKKDEGMLTIGAQPGELAHPGSGLTIAKGGVGVSMDIGNGILYNFGATSLFRRLRQHKILSDQSRGLRNQQFKRRFQSHWPQRRVLFGRRQ